MNGYLDELYKLHNHDCPRLTTAWSRVTYEEYMPIQTWVRYTFRGSPPLAVEFRLWQNSGAILPEKGPA